MDGFGPCEICGGDAWKPVYQGPVRNGKFGTLTAPTMVAECDECGVVRLAEASCHDDDFYAGPDYWASVTGGDGFSNSHEMMADVGLHGMWADGIGGKTVAEIGTGGGGFLDQIRELDEAPKTIIAIEPADALRPDLEAKGFETFAYASDAAASFAGAVDLACTFNVIEHVPDPVGFLADTAALLAPDGRLLLSTPNRDDTLMDLAPDYPQFFYRAAHRWYFDADALAACAAQVGLKISRAHYVQRYGLANALVWIRDGKPSSHDSLPGLRDARLDQNWQDNLVRRGVADRLYAVLERAAQ